MLKKDKPLDQVQNTPTTEILVDKRKVQEEPEANNTLTKVLIIEKLAKEKQIEQWVKNVSRTDLKRKFLEDLTQDIYLKLLSMPDEKIETLYETGELPFFVNRVIMNNINSTTSPYYQKYIKPSLVHDDFKCLNNLPNN